MVCMYHSLLNHSPTEGPGGDFQLLAITNKLVRVCVLSHFSHVKMREYFRVIFYKPGSTKYCQQPPEAR